MLQPEAMAASTRVRTSLGSLVVMSWTVHQTHALVNGLDKDSGADHTVPVPAITRTGHPNPPPKWAGSEWCTSTAIIEDVPRQVVAEVRWRDGKAQAVKGRAYVWGTNPKTPSPPPSEKGEDPDLDAQWRAYNRLEILLMRQALQAVVGAGLWHFDVHAGCFCTCSPGFIDNANAFRHRDIFIHVR